MRFRRERVRFMDIYLLNIFILGFTIHQFHWYVTAFTTYQGHLIRTDLLIWIWIAVTIRIMVSKSNRLKHNGTPSEKKRQQSFVGFNYTN